MSEYPIRGYSYKDFVKNRDKNDWHKRFLHNILRPLSCNPYRCSTYQFNSFKYANQIRFVAQGGSILYILNRMF